MSRTYRCCFPFPDAYIENLLKRKDLLHSLPPYNSKQGFSWGTNWQKVDYSWTATNVTSSLGKKFFLGKRINKTIRPRLPQWRALDFDFEQRKSSSWQSEPGKQDAMRTWEVPFLNGRPGMTYLEAHR